MTGQRVSEIVETVGQSMADDVAMVVAAALVLSGAVLLTRLAGPRGGVLSSRHRDEDSAGRACHDPVQGRQEPAAGLVVDNVRASRSQVCWRPSGFLQVRRG
jgi:hypothetical protein